MRLKCLRCKVSWLPRIEGRPKWCPSCHSPYWDKERTQGVVAAPVKVSRSVIVESKPKIEAAAVELKPAACKCGATGVQIVNDRKVCASCGRDRGPLKA